MSLIGSRRSSAPVSPPPLPSKDRHCDGDQSPVETCAPHALNVHPATDDAIASPTNVLAIDQLPRPAERPQSLSSQRPPPDSSDATLGTVSPLLSDRNPEHQTIRTGEHGRIPSHDAHDPFLDVLASSPSTPSSSRQSPTWTSTVGTPSGSSQSGESSSSDSGRLATPPDLPQQSINAGRGGSSTPSPSGSPLSSKAQRWSPRHSMASSDSSGPPTCVTTPPTFASADLQVLATCPLCLQCFACPMSVVPCGHVFCAPCALDCLKAQVGPYQLMILTQQVLDGHPPTCPLCRGLVHLPYPLVPNRVAAEVALECADWDEDVDARIDAWTCAVIANPEVIADELALAARTRIARGTGSNDRVQALLDRMNLVNLGSSGAAALHREVRPGLLDSVMTSLNGHGFSLENEHNFVMAWDGQRLAVLNAQVWELPDNRDDDDDDRGENESASEDADESEDDES